MEGKTNSLVLFTIGLNYLMLADGSNCQDGWLSHSGGCYIFSHSSVPWVDAVTLCNQIGGQLAEIDTILEGLYLENTAKLLNTSFYIGAHDMVVPGKWEWINSKMTLKETGYMNWAPGMPSNVTDHDCVYLGNKDGRWVNGRCFTSMYFICESH